MLQVFIAMNGMTFATVLAAHLVAVTAAFLIFHEKYEDGLVGRIALVFLLGASLAFVVDGWSGELGDVLPATALGAVSFALFLLRHAYRFTKWANDGKHDWKRGEA